MPTTLSEITERMIGGLHLTKIDEKGFHFVQGMSEMPGVVTMHSIRYIIDRFDYYSQVKINKYLEKL